MGTVLEKPVLLDETGQSIVSKLDDIKDAIGVSGEFVPIKIMITTPPTKTTYLAGESLDLTGIIVKLLASNGSQIDVTSECTFSPASGATLSESVNVVISYYWYKDDVTFSASQAVAVKTLESIAITTPPTTVDYTDGDTLDLTGLVVTATYDDTSSDDVTSECVFSPSAGAVLSTSDNAITVSFTQGGVTKTATQPITVTPKIYGVEYAGTASPILTRTDSAAEFTDPVASMSDGNGGYTAGSSPFDNIMPWSGMVRETDSNNDVWVKIPKFYYQLTTESGKLKIRVSPSPIEGFSVSPAHADRGDGEKDYVYVAAFSAVWRSGSNIFLSRSGQLSSDQRTEANWRTWMSAYTDVHLMDICMLQTLWLLYIVEFANWNSQNTIGLGTSSALTSGSTDAIPYHTGTLATSRNTQGGIKYRNIESLWGYGAFVDGFYYDNYYYAGYQTDMSKYGNTNDITKWSHNPAQSGVIKEWGILNVPIGSVSTRMLYVKSQVYSSPNYEEYVCDNYVGSQKMGSTSYTQGCFGQAIVNSPADAPKYTGLFSLYVTTVSQQQTGRAMKIPSST